MTSEEKTLEHINALVDEALPVVCSAFGVERISRPNVFLGDQTKYDPRSNTFFCSMQDYPFECLVGEEIGHTVHTVINPFIVQSRESLSKNVSSMEEYGRYLLVANLTELVGTFGAHAFMKHKGLEDVYWNHINSKREGYACLRRMGERVGIERFPNIDPYILVHDHLQRNRELPCPENMSKLLLATSWSEAMKILGGLQS